MRWPGPDDAGAAVRRPAVHLACDGQGRPLAFTLTGGNSNDCTQLESVVDGIRIARSGPGRPRTRPKWVAADKGYSSRKIRA